jgi:hypothetical protein
MTADAGNCMKRVALPEKVNSLLLKKFYSLREGLREAYLKSLWRFIEYIGTKRS